MDLPRLVHGVFQARKGDIVSLLQHQSKMFQNISILIKKSFSQKIQNMDWKSNGKTISIKLLPFLLRDLTEFSTIFPHNPMVEQVKFLPTEQV